MTERTTPIRLGFIGAGYMGQLAHIENYWKLPHVKLVALAEGRSKTAAKVARTYGIEKTYVTHADLLADATVDAVLAIGPFALNAYLVEDALNAGCHVLTEKPQVNTSAKGRELITLAERHKRVYQVGYMKRFDPGVRWAKQRIAQWNESGEVGRMISFRIWCAHGAWNWFREPPINEGDTAPHYPARLEPKPDWMTDPTWQRLTSWTNYYSHQTNLARYVAGEDYTLDSAKVVRGGQFVQCTYEGSGAQLYMDFHGLRSDRWEEGFEVIFDRARLTVAMPAPLASHQAARVIAYEHPEQGEPRTIEPSFPAIDGFAAQARQFVASVRGDEPPVSPASEAVKEVEFAEALMRYYQDHGL